MIKRDQRGFTLIELLVALAIVALIAGAAVMTMFQVINVTKSSNDRMTVIRQVQNAGYWISHDTLMAQNVVTGNDPETPEEDEFITLSWTDRKDWEDDEDDEVHKIVYTFYDMADGLKKLKRTHLIDDVISEQTLIAEYIDSAASFFEPEQDDIWKLTIRAHSGTQTETREYEINPRVNI
ncbi:hypothetical protein ES703_94084 [subsurface metagenome]